MKYWKQLQLKIKNNLATCWTTSSRRFNSLFINYRDYFNYRFLSTVIDPSIVGLCVVLGLCGAVLLLISNLYVIIWWLACVATIMWLFNKLTGSPQDQGKSPRPNPQTLQTQREAKIRVVSNGRECSNGSVIVEDRLNQSYDYGNSGRQGEETNHRQLNNNTDKDRHQSRPSSSSVANGLTTVDEEMPERHSNVTRDRSMSSLSPTEWSAVTSPGYSSRIVRAAEHDPPLREMRTPGGRTYNLSPFQRSPNRNLGIGDLPSSSSIGLWKSTVAPSPARFTSPQSANRSLSMGYHRREENPGRLFLKIAPLVGKSSPVTPGSSETPENTSAHSGGGTPGLGGTRASPITNKFSRLWPSSATKNSMDGSPSLPMTTSTPICSTLADNLNRKRMRMSEDKPETDSVSSTPSSTPAEETSSNKRLKFISTPGSSSGGGDAHGHILSNPSLASVPLTNFHNTGPGMSSESILEQMNQTEKRFLPDDDSSTTSLRPAVKRQKSNSTSGSSTTPTRLLQTPSISPAFIRKRKVLETHPPTRTPFTVVDDDTAVTKEKTPRLCGCADCYKEAAGIPLTKPETTTKPTPVVAEVPKPVTENVPSTSSGGNTVTADKKSEDVPDRQPRTEEEEPKKTETLFPYSIFDKEKHMADKIRKEARLRRILELSQENSRSSNLSQPQASSSSSSASSSVSVESTATILSQPPVIAVTTAPTTSISFSTPSSTTLAVPNTLQSTTASASATTLTTPPTTSASTAQFGFTPSISNQQATIPAATLPTTQTQPAATSSSVPSFGFSSPLAQPTMKKPETENADSPSLLQTSSPSTSTPQATFKFGTTSTSASVSATSGLAASTSTPTFGIAATAPAVAPPTVGFNFGTPTPSSGSSTSSTASTSFSFGGSSSDTASPVVKENTPSIFPAQQSTSSTKIEPAPSSTAASQPQPSLPALTPLTTPAAITFGTISTPTTSKSDTTVALPQPKTASTGQFGFPAPSTTNQQSTPSLSFPAASNPALPPTQTQSLATPAPVPAFGFNSPSTVTGGASTNNSGPGTTAFPSLQSQPTSTTSQVTVPFQFGASSPASATPVSTNSSMFGTGTTPSFGVNSTAPAPGFSFGSNTSATTAPQPFGSTSTPAFGSTVPAFGSTTTAPAFGAPNTGFNFGAQSQTTSSAAGSTTAATTNTLGFGGGMQQSQSNFGGVMQQTQSQSSPFGTNANTTTTTPAGFNFTSTQPTTVSTATGFGTSVPAFGSTTPAPAFGSTTTPAFGSTTPAPAFGSAPVPTFGGATTVPTFGAQNTGGFNFGAQTSATSGQTAATSLASASVFGTGTSSPAPAFGSNSTTPGTGSSFGFTSTPTTFASTTPQPFGSSTPAFGSTVPAFGTTSPAPAFGAPSPSTGFNFGSPAPVTSTTTGPTFGGSFGAPQPQATTGFNFGSQATSPPAFGASNQQAPSTPFQFGATANVPQGSPGFAAQQPQMFTVGGSSPSTRRPMGRGRRYR